LDGTLSFTVQARDSGSPIQTVTKDIRLTITPPMGITNLSVKDGIRTVRYNQDIKTLHGVGTVTWALESGTLPLGLTLSFFNSVGTIEGTPTDLGTFEFAIRAEDSLSPPQIAISDYRIRVSEKLAISRRNLPSGVVGSPYSTTVSATGGLAPLTWSVNSVTTLPPGLTFDSTTSKIHGDPEQAGTFYIRFDVHDSSAPPQSDSELITMEIAEPLFFTTEVLPRAKLDRAYRVILEASGGLHTVTFEMLSGTLPDGFTLNSGGALSGTPTQMGSFTFEVQTTDQSTTPQVDTKTFTLVIDDLVITSNPPVGVINHPYDENLTVTGGIPPYQFVLHGLLPPGVDFDTNLGRLFGSPLEVGLFDLDIEVIDSSNPPLTDRPINMKVFIAPPPSIRSTYINILHGILGRGYSEEIKVLDGRRPYTFSLLSGNLPDGLTLDLAGTDAFGAIHPLTGTPATLGDFTFTVKAIDSSKPPIEVTRTFTIPVVEPLEIITQTIPNGVVGEIYSVQIEANGGILPHSWWVSSNHPLPKGLFLQKTTGVLAGIPEKAFGGFTNIVVNDFGTDLGVGFSFRSGANRDFTVTIADALKILTSTLPPLRPGADFSLLLQAVGGTQPYTWTVSDGTLPPDLILVGSTGNLIGTVNTEGDFTFTIQVTDSSPAPLINTRPYTMTVSSTIGRNDSILNATPVSSGTYTVSISPYADPADTGNPDSDYFKVQGLAGTVVKIETLAAQLQPPSPLDTVIEIVDGTGTRFSTCKDPGNDSFTGPLTGDFTRSDFDDICINDDIELGVETDSMLEFDIPGAAGEIVTFYVHVLDYRGDARPEFVYQIKITGAN